MANTPNSEQRTIYGSLPGNTMTGPRAAAAQATTLISAFVGSAATIDTKFQAFLVEVANTLIALGAWKGGA